ncbi:MAG: sulfite exporter TauE/SafE family protein [Halieaceae bacterium]|jgi:sulfite exporter TauE/SafE|nr:sulfite exporter TauE/SafE family protein [Halieaceae bacterium]
MTTGTDPTPLAALLLGFLGSSHCLVMCGGISAALGMGAAPEHRGRLILLFQVGRVLTYMALGAGLGALLAGVAGLHGMALPVLRLVSAALLVSMGLTIANVWPGLAWLERAGQRLWQRIQPLARRHMPVSSARDAVLLGLYWGFLPCGLIYTALAWSATAGTPLQAAGLMGLFGLGTTPAMLATGLAANRIAALLKQKNLRQVAGLLLILAGLWTGYIAIAHGSHAAHTPESPSGGPADVPTETMHQHQH